MTIEVEGQLTEKEYAAAQWLHQKPRPAIAFAGILTLVLLLLVLWHLLFGSYSHQTGALRWAVLAFLVYLILHWTVVIPIKWRRLYRQQASLQRTYKLQISDQGISARSENLQGATAWSEYVRWKEGNGVFLLYWSDGLFQIIPQRFFPTDQQVLEFRKMLRERVGK